MKQKIFMSLILTLFGCQRAAFHQEKIEEFELTYDQVVEKTMRPFTGVSNPGVDASTIHGKVMCGYQGWFTCPGDGSGMGWFHWGFPFAAPADTFRPGRCSIDLWPDMTEYHASDKFATAFLHADGSRASVYSSMRPGVADLHFKWMKEYGIDGVFIQRFVVQTFKPFELNHVNTVFSNCREAAHKHGRVYALMYDLSGMNAGQMDHVISDIKLLIDKMELAKDPAYLHHSGKPLIGIWGIGFNGRKYKARDCKLLIEFLKTDKKYGIFTVMVGIPTYWRQGINDALEDKELIDVLKMTDMISPWSVGRFRTIEDIYKRTMPLWREDIKWCSENNLEFLPVVFPGFSWYNMLGRAYNVIPRLKGDFLWKQFYAAERIGAKMVYVAMFDEVDEGTAIYKCTNDPAVGESKFLTYEGLPSDYYLRLVGAGRKMLNKAIPSTDFQPGELQKLWHE